MKRFNLLTLLAVIVIAAMVLTACPSGSTGGAATPVPATEVPVEPTAVPEPPRLRPSRQAVPEPTEAMTMTETMTDTAAMRIPAPTAARSSPSRPWTI